MLKYWRSYCVFFIATFLFFLSMVDKPLLAATNTTNFISCKNSPNAPNTAAKVELCRQVVPYFTGVSSTGEIQLEKCANSTGTVFTDEDGDEIEIKLEPSGLVYDRDREIWIGVADNFNELKKCENFDVAGFAVFYFEAGDFSSKIIKAHPLLTQADAQQTKPFDLEGIAHDLGTDLFYITGSMSKHAENPSRDTWHRNKVFVFEIKTAGNNFEAENIENPFPGWPWDFRYWMESERSINWFYPHNGQDCVSIFGNEKCNDLLDAALRGRPETQGGLNVEALALMPPSQETATNEPVMMFGLRGPIFEDVSGFVPVMLASFLEVEAVGLTLTPQLNGQSFMETPPVTGGSTGFSFRAMAKLVDPQINEDIFAVILGANDGAYDQLDVGLTTANANGMYQWIGAPEKLPPRFVGEGIAIRDISFDENLQQFVITADVVSDLNGYFMEIEFRYKP